MLKQCVLEFVVSHLHANIKEQCVCSFFFSFIFIYLFLIFIFSFIFISWRLIILQYCSAFCIHWHVCVFLRYALESLCPLLTPSSGKGCFWWESLSRYSLTSSFVHWELCCPEKAHALVVSNPKVYVVGRSLAFGESSPWSCTLETVINFETWKSVSAWTYF